MSHKIRILLLEADPEDAVRIERELRKSSLNCELTRVHAREDCIKVLDANPPDVVLSGYDLLQWTAMDALRLLQERRQRIPFILIAAAKSAVDLREMMHLGADDHVLKDDIHRIPSAIKSLLQKRQTKMDNHRNEAFLKESEEQYRVLFNENPCPMWVCDRQKLEILAVNRAAIDRYGYSIGEFLHMSLHALFAPDVEEMLKQSISRIKTSEDADLTKAGVWKHRKKDGSTIHVDMLWSNILFYGNKSILVMGTDVTQSLLAYRRKAAQYAVAQALANAKSLAEAAPKILRAMCENLDWDYGAIWASSSLPNQLRCIAAWHVPTLDLHEFDAVNREAVILPEKGLPGPATQPREPIWTDKIDPWLPASCIEMAAKTGLKSAVICPILDGNNVIGFLKFLTRTVQKPDPDLLPTISVLGIQISQFIQRSHAESAKQSLEDQLRQAQKIEAIGRLAGGVAHDFNNLLTAIAGYSDLLLESLKAGDPNRADVEEIKKAAKRATALTRQLLTFSRKQVLQPRIINLKSVLSDTENMLQRMAGAQISLSVICDPDTGAVKADPTQIEQVIMNLVVNACDAISGEGKITIETGNVVLGEADARQHLGASPGVYVVLSVSDTGVGMDAETKSHLFEPFFTTKDKDKGTGLGLSTVYGIIRQAEGHIAVESALGEGSIFRIYLPIAQDAKETPVPNQIAPRNFKGTETILLVEDENVVRDMAKRVLEKHGYRVLEARHGRDALMICKDNSSKIDLLLTDIVMPEMNGHELAEQVATSWPDIRIIFMSGYTDLPVLRQKVYDAKLVFLQKPFSPDLLVQTLRKTLDKKPA